VEFDYRTVICDETFRTLNEIKAFHPEVVEQEAAKRRKPGFPHDRLVFAAADHNARMINEYKGNPIGLSNRREYISRLVRMLESDSVDGIEATPDVIEDLFILNKLRRDAGEKEFLSGKMLVGTVNRGGLKNTVWEMDDMPACYTVERLAKLRMDGVKFMIRLNPMDERAKYTVRYCADAVNAAEKAGLPIFIEALYVETTEKGFAMRTDSESLCKVVGVTAALGCRSVGKWIEVPLNNEYQIPVSATTCPVLVVPDEVENEPLDVVKEYTKEKGLCDNIRGILLGRNVMYNREDPLPIAEAIADVWHGCGTPEEMYGQALKKFV
jgi:DhnA family fructose-bisphosphate aldolase class Ia